MRLFRGIRDVRRGRSDAHLRRRHQIASIVAAWVDAVGTVLILMFEHNARGSEISNFGDALFWTTAQLLTVSSQMYAAA